ncbi:hypothetical protein [Fibrella forsythiae]|uniref:Uncharacterized protein n=1 Tax=Fibrella forsythiae TaxID=2817061 RepID=A0ABS3JNI5_9BACT|nr:hypothetical protein [Fibrella forsythiae]MBO0951561.1 hypothetical protein [Fibrella forsythiae]
MVIFITALFSPTDIRSFSAQILSLEEGFDFLNDLVGTGFVLVDVRLLDQSRIIPLPIEGFDGSPSSTAIRQLEEEWTNLLKSPDEKP